MNILTKMRASVEQLRETEALKKIFGNNPFPKERIPYINLANHASDTSNNPNETGIKGVFSQKTLDYALMDNSAGSIKLGSIANNSATKTATSIAIKAELTAGGSGYDIPPIPTATPQGADIGNLAVIMPTYTCTVVSGVVTSLTQTTSGSNITATPLLSFAVISGHTGSGASGYIILNNNYLDEKLLLLNPTNLGAVSKIKKDLADNYLTSTQTNALLVNKLQQPDWFEDFDGVFNSTNLNGLTNSNFNRELLLNFTYTGATVSQKGWTLKTEGVSNTTACYYDYWKGAAGNNTVTGDAPAGVITVGGYSPYSGSGDNIIQLSNGNQGMPLSTVRSQKFRFRLCSILQNLSAGASQKILLGVTDTYLTNSMNNGAYFFLNSTDSGTANSANINWAGANSGCRVVVNGVTTVQYITTPNAAIPINVKNYNTYEVKCTGTAYEFYINGVLVVTSVPFIPNSSMIYPFLQIQGPGGGTTFMPAICIDYINTSVTLPTARI